MRRPSSAGLAAKGRNQSAYACVDEQERLTVAALGVLDLHARDHRCFDRLRFARTADLHYPILDSMHALYQGEPWRRMEIVTLEHDLTMHGGRW